MRKAIGLAVAALTLLCSAARAQDAPIAPQASPSLEASRVFRSAGPGALFGFQLFNNNAAARSVLILDAAAAPTTGAAVTPVMWYSLAGSGSAPSNAIFVNLNVPARFLTGIVFLCSSNASVFTFTSAADCAFSVQAQ